MYATVRRLRADGQAREVCQMMEAEYTPRLAGVDGVVSYTLICVGEDEVTAVGVFASEKSAVQATELLHVWAQKRLSALGATPLGALEGEVPLHLAYPA